MKKILFLLFLFFGGITSNALVTAQQTTNVTLTESQKIDSLYSYIQSLKGVTFYRNGSYYQLPEAISHLKMKQGKAGSSANNARKFIDNVASESSMSGTPYKIKFSTGEELELKDLLNKRLVEIEKLPATSLKI